MIHDEIEEEQPGLPHEGENDPSLAMTEPADAEDVNDQKFFEDFPGFPHHPANEELLMEGAENVEDIGVESDEEDTE